MVSANNPLGEIVLEVDLACIFRGKIAVIVGRDLNDNADVTHLFVVGVVEPIFYFTTGRLNVLDVVVTKDVIMTH